LAPTFIPFTPWTTRENYRSFLNTLAELDLVSQVAPIQLAIRLLIPEGSLLLELPEIRTLIQPFDPRALYYPWRHADPWLDHLCHEIQVLIKAEERHCSSRQQIFGRIWRLAEAGPFPQIPLPARATVPYLTEPWYC
jgi:hypothetical protein